MMTADSDADELVGSVADERLLDEDPANLPVALGRPEMIPPSSIRGRLVGLGATLTGVTLLGGVALIVFGLVDALSDGVGFLGVAALAVGIALVSTHWGWVHVAEATADAIEGRRNRGITARRRQWLETIEPYARYEVVTSVADDGSLTIKRLRHRPVRTGDQAFAFVRETESEEIHASDEPAAGVAERAELLRRHAALETEREHRRFQIAADAHELVRLGESDERQQLAARRAESEALSERINSHLRDPPVTE